MQELRVKEEEEADRDPVLSLRRVPFAKHRRPPEAPIPHSHDDVVQQENLEEASGLLERLLLSRPWLKAPAHVDCAVHAVAIPSPPSESKQLPVKSQKPPNLNNQQQVAAAAQQQPAGPSKPKQPCPPPTAGPPLLSPTAHRVFTFDFETTGFMAKGHPCRLLDVAVVDVATGAHYSTLVDPQRSFKSQGAVHGITAADVRGQPTAGAAIKGMLTFIEASCSAEGQTPVLVAHNGARFDFLVLQSECQRCRVPLPLSWLCLDTCQLARALSLKQAAQKLSQASLLQYFGLPSPTDAHRALPDAQALVQLYGALMDRAAEVLASKQLPGAAVADGVGLTVGQLQHHWPSLVVLLSTFKAEGEGEGQGGAADEPWTLAGAVQGVAAGLSTHLLLEVDELARRCEAGGIGPDPAEMERQDRRSAAAGSGRFLPLVVLPRQARGVQQGGGAGGGAPGACPAAGSKPATGPEQQRPLNQQQQGQQGQLQRQSTQQQQQQQGQQGQQQQPNQQQQRQQGQQQQPEQGQQQQWQQSLARPLAQPRQRPLVLLEQLRIEQDLSPKYAYKEGDKPHWVVALGSGCSARDAPSTQLHKLCTCLNTLSRQVLGGAFPSPLQLSGTQIKVTLQAEVKRTEVAGRTTQVEWALHTGMSSRQTGRDMRPQLQGVAWAPAAMQPGNRMDQSGMQRLDSAKAGNLRSVNSALGGRGRVVDALLSPDLLWCTPDGRAGIRLVAVHLFL